MAICSVEGCQDIATRKGMCSKHYQRQYLYGRTHKIKGLVKGKCTVEGCNEFIKGYGFCNTHYQLWRRNGKTEKLKREKTSNPFYGLWFERKQLNLLCNEWLDFTTFVKGITPKPEGNYFLVRFRNEPFGPDNFEWREHLKRKEGETKKEWNARQRTARIVANPSMESDRNIKRTYGLTRIKYNEIFWFQNGACAICKEREKSIDGKSGSMKRLAVDHCHKTNKIRGLLCWRCNTMIGKINENIELLEAMKQYLINHKDL